MADIFISYNRQDAPVARQFVEALEAGGFDVWWDATLKSGDAYDVVTEAALRSARAVIVLWSSRSVKSRWVRAEATLADRAGTMVPVMIEDCERPIMFELTQSADLMEWRGDPADRAWKRFTADLADFLGKPHPDSSADTAVSPGPAVPELSIAVLPFSDLSAEGDKAYLGDGVAEEILNALIKVKAVKVVGRTSSFSFRDSGSGIAEIARQLGVAHVLEGSVRTHGDRVRITAQLTDAADGAHSWSESFDGSLEDIFDLQDEIARAVAKAMKVVLGVGQDRLANSLTKNSNAYDAFLKGRELLHRLSGQDTLPRAVEYFEQAVELDPDFGEAWLFLSLAHYHLPDNSITDDVRGHFAAANAAMDRAALICPDDAIYHRVLAAKRITEGRFDQAFEAYERAYEINPDGPDIAYGKAYCFMSIGLWRKAEEYLERARKLDPTAPLPVWGAGCLNLIKGDLKKACDDFRHCFDLGFATGGFHLGMVLSMQGRIDEAYEFGERYVVNSSPWSRKVMSSALVRKIYFAAVLRRKPVARWLVIQSMRRRLSRPDYQPNSLDGAGLFYVGAVEDFMLHVRHNPTTYTLSSFNMIFWSTPEARKMRTHPDFPQFVDDIGFVRLWQKHGWPDQITPNEGTDGSNLQFTCT